MEHSNENIYLFHDSNDQYQFCYKKDHCKFQGDCYYKVSRPTFMESCDCRLTQRAKEIVFKIYICLGLKCKCVTNNRCKMCSYLCDHEEDPILYIDSENIMSIDMLFKMLDFMK